MNENLHKLISEYIDDLEENVLPVMHDVHSRWAGKFIGLRDYDLPPELDRRLGVLGEKLADFLESLYE